MLPQEFDEKKVLAIIKNNPDITKQLSFEDGFIVKKGYEHLFTQRAIREKISRDFTEIARTFVTNLTKNNCNVRLAAVCGSVAYGSASISDDIDLFIIARKNRLWLVFFKALLLARVFNFKASIRGEESRFCLSYMQDEVEFEKELQRKTALMARELLSIIILVGKGVYQKLLVKAKWIECFFPILTASKLNLNENDDSLGSDDDISILKDVANSVLFVGISRFLFFKAFLRNLKYKKDRKKKDVFKTNITKGSCVYTSLKYKELERMYQL